MQANRTDAERGKRASGSEWLKLAVYFDAARVAPHAWLTALWWRMLGKKVRARAQFAPLLAASPRAYRLWLLSEPAPEISGAAEGPDIVALVGAGPGQADTIDRVCEQGVTVLPLGTPEVPDLAAAAAQIDWNSAPWLMPLMAGDVLATGAIAAYKAAAIRTRGSIVYADDDILGAGGRRTAPHFKANNDVNLCMRLNSRGWQAFYEPRATLIHHESVSRGFDRDPVGAARLAGELAALKAAWGTGGNVDEEIDPYHHPQLSEFSEHFVIRLGFVAQIGR